MPQPITDNATINALVIISDGLRDANNIIGEMAMQMGAGKPVDPALCRRLIRLTTAAAMTAACLTDQ